MSGEAAVITYTNTNTAQQRSSNCITFFLWLEVLTVHPECVNTAQLPL